MTGSHPVVSVHGGGSSSDSILTPILLLPLLWDRADNDLLLLVGSFSGAASGGASAVAIDVGDDQVRFLCASSYAVAASSDYPGT